MDCFSLRFCVRAGEREREIGRERERENLGSLFLTLCSPSKRLLGLIPSVRSDFSRVQVFSSKGSWSDSTWPLLTSLWMLGAPTNLIYGSLLSKWTHRLNNLQVLKGDFEFKLHWLVESKFTLNLLPIKWSVEMLLGNFDYECFSSPRNSSHFFFTGFTSRFSSEIVVGFS